MHNLMHSDYVKASAQRVRNGRAVAPHERLHAPPGRARVALARALASVASRVDREAARRAVA